MCIFIIFTKRNRFLLFVCIKFLKSSNIKSIKVRKPIYAKKPGYFFTIFTLLICTQYRAVLQEKTVVLR